MPRKREINVHFPSPRPQGTTRTNELRPRESKSPAIKGEVQADTTHGSEGWRRKVLVLYPPGLEGVTSLMLPKGQLFQGMVFYSA